MPREARSSGEALERAAGVCGRRLQSGNSPTRVKLARRLAYRSARSGQLIDVNETSAILDGDNRYAHGANCNATSRRPQLPKNFASEAPCGGFACQDRKTKARPLLLRISAHFIVVTVKSDAGRDWRRGGAGLARLRRVQGAPCRRRCASGDARRRRASACVRSSII
jgi:hypothetical protein